MVGMRTIKKSETGKKDKVQRRFRILNKMMRNNPLRK